ncbi:ribonuclease E activity regulator RraA [Thalassococcus sp. S3]|uniref:ribonuclease E activity regulator RraA n=1 Tax=Thalassococcus sp. S3 TaxID=2017482 RepID=UPI0010246932|nr:ribonuclease E activity regulator RraA [Thalassococcus sp. S3]QBF30163.1 S-adenosylmethionine--2-demethylmenaquinone methyltransferase [Thalassococcus sp. S3]
MKTADLIDNHAEKLSLIHLPLRQFGTKTHFAGPVQTVKCFEDNTIVRAQLETPGEGRILVVDGGGSTRIALLGDMLAQLAIDNGWAGIVLNAAIRDSVEIADMDTLVFALATSPVKSAKEGWGKTECPIHIGGVEIIPGDWLYGDADGVLHSKVKLT